jgi:hypothetical protein
VFVEQDAGFAIAKEQRQRSLAVKERFTAQILAIKLDQVKRVEDCRSSGLSTRQLLEPPAELAPALA